ncbi:MULTISPECIES: hypothetical protein [Halobacillus]|uniref:Uncharacterized protein n=2 Tax=Halobacillus TaxID=45667 RepID=A0A1H0IYA5_HALAD|nr:MULTISPECIES: hypothetical protein [Halobacillus]REJ07564.1 hypothetical protein DYE48_15875 [Halobacillus trueperi]SDO36445.1 hypothetical protein SAMN05421677_104226 [Halobacillus aidingensis]
MVTIAFVFILISSTLLSILLDMHLYNLSFFQTLHFSLTLDAGTRETIVFTALITGLFASFFLDYRMSKKESREKRS